MHPKKGLSNTVLYPLPFYQVDLAAHESSVAVTSSKFIATLLWLKLLPVRSGDLVRLVLVWCPIHTQHESSAFGRTIHWVQGAPSPPPPRLRDVMCEWSPLTRQAQQSPQEGDLTGAWSAVVQNRWTVFVFGKWTTMSHYGRTITSSRRLRAHALPLSRQYTQAETRDIVCRSIVTSDVRPFFEGKRTERGERRRRARNQR